MSRRLLAACALVALPVLALAQTAAVKPDGRLGYALGGGAQVLSKTGLSTARVNLGGEAALATPDSQWRIGCKALWSRTAADATEENVTVTLVQESRHRWRSGTWFSQKLSLSPALRPGESVRGTFATGLAVAMTPLMHWNIGVTQHYDGALGPVKGDTRFITGIALRID